MEEGGGVKDWEWWSGIGSGRQRGEREEGWGGGTDEEMDGVRSKTCNL